MEVMVKLLQWAGLAVAGVAAAFGNLPVTIQVLLVVMIVDVLFGFLRSFTQQRLSSTAAWAGVTRKIGTLLMVCLAYYIGEISRLPGVPVALGSLAAGYYIYQESLSILENASILGLPIPNFLRDALSQLSVSDDRRKSKFVKIVTESEPKEVTL